MVERALATDDSLLRGQLLSAAASTKKPELAQRVLALALDERVRVSELWTPLRAQIGMPETRDAAWTWMTQNFDALKARLEMGAGRLPAVGQGFCSVERAQEVESFFAERITDLAGGPRNLANVLEQINLCAARVEAQKESAQAFFSRAR